MMRKPIMEDKAVPFRFVLITLDSHMSSTVMRAQKLLKKDMSGLELNAHAATDWANNPLALEKCLKDIAEGDIIFVSMLFIEDHINPILQALKDRREACDAMVAIMGVDGFWELKRTRTERPEFGDRPS